MFDWILNMPPCFYLKAFRFFEVFIFIFKYLSSILFNIIQLTTYNKIILNNELLIKEQPRT